MQYFVIASLANAAAFSSHSGVMSEYLWTTLGIFTAWNDELINKQKWVEMGRQPRTSIPDSVTVLLLNCKIQATTKHRHVWGCEEVCIADVGKCGVIILPRRLTTGIFLCLFLLRIFFFFFVCVCVGGQISIYLLYDLPPRAPASTETTFYTTKWRQKAIFYNNSSSRRCLERSSLDGLSMNAHVRSLVEKVGNYKETFLVAKKNTPRVTEQAQ